MYAKSFAGSIPSLLAALALALCVPASWSQANTTRADGRITDSGKSLVGVQVVLSNQDTFQAFRATTDKYGTFSISDVPRGTYIVSILNAAGDKLFRNTLKLTSAPDAPIRVDLDISPTAAAPPATSTNASPATSTGPPASSSSSAPAPDSAKNSEVDTLIHRYNDALRANDQQAQIAALKAIIAADPSRWDYFAALGYAQYVAGDFEHAAESYESGIQAAQRFISSKPADGSTVLKSDRDLAQAGMVQMLVNQGNAYLKLKKNKEALASAAKAAELSPDQDTTYFNLCVMYYNTQTLDGAVDACNKAIAANPNRADAYFIEGAILFSSAKTNKDGSRTAAAGTIEALEKYLHLAPAGAHAAEAKLMLDYLKKPGTP